MTLQQNTEYSLHPLQLDPRCCKSSQCTEPPLNFNQNAAVFKSVKAADGRGCSSLDRNQHTSFSCRLSFLFSSSPLLFSLLSLLSSLVSCLSQLRPPGTPNQHTSLGVLYELLC